MHTFKSWKRLPAAVGLLLASQLASQQAFGADIALNDNPIFSTVEVPGNLSLTLSVEWPTALSPAYPNTETYTPTKTFIGYFDANKCYRYQANTTTPADSYFVPYAITSDRRCSSSASTALWSGNYLNWASMGALDTFRMVLTGGNRTIDTTTLTVLEKAYNYSPGTSNAYSLEKAVTSDVAGATPFAWASLTSRTHQQGISMLVSRDFSGTEVNYTQQSAPSGTASASRVYRLYIRVQVCDATVGRESNCIVYGSNAKPEGLMQKYASKLRYNAFGYLMTSTQNDGAVMRARMKFIGPTQPVPSSLPVTNSQAEWSSSTGVMIANPDTADASATVTNFSLPAGTVSQSGVMNYLNKFGRAAQNYKSYDPVSELYYASLRYFKNGGNVAAYTAPTDASNTDGFPVITNWGDPMLYSCQKNFILGIGDTNSWGDANLEDSSIKTSYDAGATPGQMTSRGVTAATNMVGQLEGRGTLGTTLRGGRNDTWFIAGMAYDAHTVDLRSDLAGTQTIDTYWLDVMELQSYESKNQYWMAAKYGGFKAPTGFDPYAGGNGTGTLALGDWHTNTDSVGSDPRPDNYFAANQADTMKAGLTSAFEKIAAATDAANSTAFTTASPNVTNAGTLSYASRYDPKTWTGELTAARVSYDAQGTPTATPMWNARTLLSAAAVTPATRKIVTCCTSAGAALPFSAAALGAGGLHARTYYASFGNVAGVNSALQSSANFVAYLRGDTGQETANGGAYRSRSYRLGDIVNAKPVVVAAPAGPYFDDQNPGYSSFKSTYASRRSVVYAGANDGMLHAFDASVGEASSGSELFAYIPSFLYGNASSAASTGLAALGNPNYAHRYYVDATPAVFDVDLNRTGGATTASGDWRTLLIGGLGKGGTGYYAIDVTNPAAWTSESAVAGKVMWEFTDSRMGYSYGRPSVVKTAKYGWVVVLTSGYNNSDGKGWFFIVNPKTGALLEAVATPLGSTTEPLNLAHHTAYVASYADMTADAVYAGDLQGNLWRLDVSAASGSYAAPTRIARLTNAGGVAQAVTIRPLVEVDPATQRRYVMVGTGRLLADADITSSIGQGFYAIADGGADSGTFYTSATLPGGATYPITRAALLPNTNLATGAGTPTASTLGWYYDLPLTNNIGERVSVDATANQGVIAFVSVLPSGGVCTPSGSGRLFALGFGDGKSVLQDASGNLITASTPVNSLLTDVAIQRVRGKLRLYAGGSGGELVKAPAQLRAAGAVRPLNWREAPPAD